MDLSKSDSSSVLLILPSGKKLNLNECKCSLTEDSIHLRLFSNKGFNIYSLDVDASADLAIATFKYETDVKDLDLTVKGGEVKVYLNESYRSDSRIQGKIEYSGTFKDNFNNNKLEKVLIKGRFSCECGLRKSKARTVATELP